VVIVDFVKRRGLLLALIFIAGWGAALKLENHSLTNQIERCQQGKALIVAAVKEADALAQAAREDEERRSAANAERSDAFHAQDLERAAVAGRDYARVNRIAAGGVRGEAPESDSIEASAAAPGGSAGFPAEVPADSLVAVSSSDLQACTTAVTYAVGAHNWAATVSDERGQAPHDPPPNE
jgi:hypothetical protein